MKSKKLLIAFVVVAALGSARMLWRQFSGPRLNLKPSAAAGEVLAEEVGRLLGGRGKVVIIGREVSKDGTDAAGQRVLSLTQALQAQKALQLAGTEWIPRPAGPMDLGGVSLDQLLAVIQKQADANAFVIFAGLPPYSQPLLDQLSARSLKMIVVCGYGPEVRRWLEAKALAMAIVPRFDDVPANAPPPKTTRDWFQREFEIVTPDTVARLPY
jgi:hypothetical protein